MATSTALVKSEVQTHNTGLRIFGNRFVGHIQITRNGSHCMSPEQLSAAAQTVVQLGDYLENLKAEVLKIFQPTVVATRGYITSSEELQVRQLQLSYWKTRNALLEQLDEIRQGVVSLDQATPHEFVIAFADAVLLVDAARFLREVFHHSTVVRRKLDEPDPVHGIPPRMYDQVQKSLTNPYHAWHLWQAARYYDNHREDLRHAAAADGLESLISIIDRLRDRLRLTLWTYLRTRLRVRGRSAARRVGRDVVGRGLYAVNEAVGRGMSHISVQPGHLPSLPRDIRSQLVGLLRPGDVLVVRKEFAATNYFLPGYWPHAALYLGTIGDLAERGLADHEHVRPRWSQLSAAGPATAVLLPDESQSWADGDPHPCVLEAMKDGVRIRSINSPFNADSVVVVQPLLGTEEVAAGLARALMHEGKSYDFDFDFSVSHRLVCTEVVYRAYEGMGGVRFDLQRHVGRYALSAGDLLRMALARQHFEVVAVYSTAHSPRLETGVAAERIVRSVERNRG
jgi:hypothetical protein